MDMEQFCNWCNIKSYEYHPLSIEKKHKTFTILSAELRNSHNWYLTWTSQGILISPYNRIVTAT